MIQVAPHICISAAELSFSFARSSGPGGQNVNKVNSKALLRWNFAGSQIPIDVKERFRKAFGSRLTKEGELLVTSDRFRDQARNHDDCLEKLREMLLTVAYPPKKRKKTKPTRSSQERRHSSKKKQGEKKRGRSRPSWD